MPKVPKYNLKPIKTIYNPASPHKPASLKQRNLILTLCERRKIAPPDLKRLTTGQAAELISSMLNDGHFTDND